MVLTRNKIRKLFEKVEPKFFSLTIDLWSDKGANHTYLGLTAHFVLEKLNSAFLGSREIYDKRLTKFYIIYIFYALVARA